MGWRVFPHPIHRPYTTSNFATVCTCGYLPDRAVPEVPKRVILDHREDTSFGGDFPFRIPGDFVVLGVAENTN